MNDTIICLVGASGTGKTSVAYALAEQYGYNVIESYTTRPPRHEGEKGHVFVWHEDEVEHENWMHSLKINNQIIAYNCYNNYDYWATADQYRGKGISLYVVDVPGVKMLRQTVKDARVVVVALVADEEMKRERLWDRAAEGRNKKLTHKKVDGIDTRLKYDHQAFAVIPCDYCIDADADLPTVVARVQGVIEEASA